ncbi:3-dehydroquinate dehydratase [Candidatus Bathyarchaeota archaeon]|nr:3-dehydroquinate dehydratase [Candidatus Bathyarchaeota archaeon]MDP6047856.1 ABC transporter ATP-binding protein [Candidatus Bathyarchaeota archaeon]
METVIEVDKLVKYFKNHLILDGIDLKVVKGEIHGLIGSNGAGKSTTLKILCGLIKPSSGIVRINNLILDKNRHSISKILGYIPETPELYPSLTVRETLDFIGAIHSIPADVLNLRILNYMQKFEIQHLSKKFIGSLSRGELQRVLICSVMMREPKIFLLDEPFYALDPKSAKIFCEILRRKSEKTATVLLATHLLDVAEKICDSITIIDGGTTVASGNLSDIKKVGDRECTLEEAFIEYTG